MAQFPSPDEGSGDQSEAPPTLTPSPRQLRVQAIEKGARSSVLGCVLQPLLAVVSDPSVCSLQMANTIQRNLSRLAELSAQVGRAVLGGGGLQSRGGAGKLSMGVILIWTV